MENSNYYDLIMEIPGCEDIKKLVKNFKNVSKNIKKMPNNMAVIIPDFIWDTRSGAGKTHLLKLLSEYLYSERVIEFYGDVKFFEFLIDYCNPTQELTELTRLIRDVDNAAGFRSQYCGLLALDISAWKGHYSEVYFQRIMEYLSSIDDKVCIIFIVENFTENEIKEADYMLSGFFRIRRIKLSYPSSSQFLDYIYNKLEKYGLELNDEARELLKESVDELRNFKYFDGYKTINRMCQDIVFDLCMSEKFNSKSIGKETLIRYSKNGEFVQSMKEIATVKKVGYGGRKNE